MKTLAQRLVACKQFKWMRGMSTACGILVRKGTRRSLNGYREYEGEGGGATAVWAAGAHDYLPDLTDPATLGCLLALVREAHKEATIHVVAQRSDWDDMVVWHVVSAQQDRALGTGDTEAEALVAALEAA